MVAFWQCPRVTISPAYILGAKEPQDRKLTILTTGKCHPLLPQAVLRAFVCPQSTCFHRQTLVMAGGPINLARCPPALEALELYLNKVWV